MAADWTAVRQAAAYHLRAARPGDERLLWEWANEGEVRRQAFHSEPIAWQTHTVWFARALADPHCLLLVFENSLGVPVGQLRFEETAEGLEVDVSVAPTHRGQGLGHVLLAQGFEAAAGRWLKGTAVIAKALVGNERSKRVFEQNGFIDRGVRTHEGKAFHQLERTL